MMIFFGPSWKGYSIPFKLFIKCLFPPGLLQLYIFGWSDRFVKHWSFRAYQEDLKTVDEPLPPVNEAEEIIKNS